MLERARFRLEFLGAGGQGPLQFLGAPRSRDVTLAFLAELAAGFVEVGRRARGLLLESFNLFAQFLFAGQRTLLRFGARPGLLLQGCLGLFTPPITITASIFQLLRERPPNPVYQRGPCACYAQC